MESTMAKHDSVMSRFRAQLAEGETSDRTFGLAVGATLLALSFVPLIRHHPPRIWMAVVGIVLGVLGAVAPKVLHAIKRGWLFLGFLLGLVVSPITLGILFYAVITPCGFLMRWFGGDPLRLRLSMLPSYWRERTEPLSSMQDQF
jgi:hypothetical protein